MHHVREVHLDRPGDRSEHVAWVRYSSRPAGPMRVATRDQLFAWVTSGQPLRTYAPDGTEADVVARISATGTRYVTTVANGQETDDLLRLPRC